MLIGALVVESWLHPALQTRYPSTNGTPQHFLTGGLQVRSDDNFFIVVEPAMTQTGLACYSDRREGCWESGMGEPDSGPGLSARPTFGVPARI
jgi:hypothetical protein